MKVGWESWHPKKPGGTSIFTENAETDAAAQQILKRTNLITHKSSTVNIGHGWSWCKSQMWKSSSAAVPGLWRPFGSLTFPVPRLPRNGEHSIATGISSMTKPQSLHDCLDPKFTKFIWILHVFFEVVVRIYMTICVCCCICWSCYCFVVALLSLSLSSSLFGSWNKSVEKVWKQVLPRHHDK